MRRMLIAVVATALAACAEDSTEGALDDPPTFSRSAQETPEPTQQGSNEDSGAGLPSPALALNLNGYALTRAELTLLLDMAATLSREVPSFELSASTFALAAWWGLWHGVAETTDPRNLSRCVLTAGSTQLTGLQSCALKSRWYEGASASQVIYISDQAAQDAIERTHPAADEATILRRALFRAGYTESSWVVAHVVNERAGRGTSEQVRRYLVRDVAVGALLQGEQIRARCVEDATPAPTCFDPSSRDPRQLALAGSAEAMNTTVVALRQFLLAHAARTAEPLQPESELEPMRGCAGREDGTYCQWALLGRPSSTKLACANGVAKPGVACAWGCAVSAEGNAECLAR